MFRQLKNQFIHISLDDKKFFIRLFACTLLINVLMAIYSVGFYHPDEHFQIIEFMNYKLGNIPASNLTWEFGTQIRPWLQVGFYFLTYKIIHFFYNFSPFTTAMIFHVETAVLTTLAQGLFLISLYRVKKSDFSWKLICFFIFLFWIFPYLSVRTSSENFANTFLLMSVAFFLLSIPSQFPLALNKLFQKFEISPLHLIILGCLFGLTFEFRFQSAFLIFGFCLWIFFNINHKTVFVCSILTGFLSILFLSLFVDKWGYGVYSFPPYQYFKVNILHGMAAQFGVMPWYEYAHQFIKYCFYPFGILLAYLYIMSFIKYPLHLFHWIIIPFVLMHFSVDHKEVRFLFPILNSAIVPIGDLLAEYKNDPFLDFVWRRFVIKSILGVLFLLNTFLMLGNLFDPPHKRGINILNFIQNEMPSEAKTCMYYPTEVNPIVDSDLYYITKDAIVPLQLHFFEQGIINGLIPLNDLSQLENKNGAANPLKCLLIQESKLVEPELMNQILNQCHIVHIDSVIPNWFYKHWPVIFSHIWDVNDSALVLKCGAIT